MADSSQPYDSSLKALFEGHAAEVSTTWWEQLTELAQQASAEVKEPHHLRRLVRQLSTVPDENAARWLLRTFAA